MTATEAVRTTVKKAVKSGKLEAYKEPLKKAAKTAVGASLPIAAAVGGGMAVSRLQKSRVSKQAKKMLDDTIRRTPAGQRNQFTPEVRAALLAQYEQHIRRQNEILFTK